jgi:hypothetical protein
MDQKIVGAPLTRAHVTLQRLEASVNLQPPESEPPTGDPPGPIADGIPKQPEPKPEPPYRLDTALSRNEVAAMISEAIAAGHTWRDGELLPILTALNDAIGLFDQLQLDMATQLAQARTEIANVKAEIAERRTEAARQLGANLNAYTEQTHKLVALCNRLENLLLASKLTETEVVDLATRRAG